MAANYDFPDQAAMRPTARTWMRHLAFLLITFCTATIAGSMFPFGEHVPEFLRADPQSWDEAAGFLTNFFPSYVYEIVAVVRHLFNDREFLAKGLSFSLSLLFILTSHEMGHYVACRLYKVDATLPYFLPTPPLIGPAGTFGAFIRIKSPLPSRRATFDIGVAGPIAGFIALIPIAIVGIATMEPMRAGAAIPPGSLIFSDALLPRIIGAAFGIDPEFAFGNPFYFAAWVGCLVTALNLIPSGQLDGGHAIYAVLGERIHYWTGRIAFIVMAALSIIGWTYFNSPSGFLISVILGVMMFVKHPEPYDKTPLDGRRKLIAILTLVIFILCFTPFPIRFT
jgi:membrane-associated protease RseP (regulator of RpoE activity)